MSFRDDMVDIIIDFRELDMFPENRIDRLIQGAIRSSGLNLTYNVNTGEINEDISNSNYDILSMYFELSALEKIRNKYISESFSVSDEEGSGDFRKRTDDIDRKIEEIKNSQLYKSQNIPFIFSSF